MSVGNNFVDLRMANAGISGDSEDSIWPSFTDIMTVVLMIFLMSLFAFLIRNTQLVDELLTALIEKEQISQQEQQSADENSSLQTHLALVRERILSLETSLQAVTGARNTLQQTLQQRENTVRELETEIALLTRLRDQLSDSNSDLIKQLDLKGIALTETEQTLEDTRDSLAATELELKETEIEFSESKNTLNEKISLLLAAKAGLVIAKEKTELSLSDAEKEKLELNRKILAMTEQLRLINEQLDSQTSVNETLDSELESQRLIMEGLTVSKEELEEKLLEMTASLEHLQKLYDLRGLVVNDLRAELAGGELRFKSLQEEYDSLDEEYRKLIRPARSPAGKYVVDVYFAKQNGQSVYRIRLPEQDEPETVSMAELDSRLSKLKAEHKQALYTKVRIDDKSGIGFNEAWQFTQKMLSEYDYYSHDYSDLVPDPGIE